MRCLFILMILFVKLISAQNEKSDLFGFATSNSFIYCDVNDSIFMQYVKDLNPRVLRFPGGAVGNYYHYGKPGYGFDFEEIQKYDAGKFLKRAKGLVRDIERRNHYHNYIQDFITLTKSTNSKVILVANMFIDNDDILHMIKDMKKYNIEIVGVELGSELTNRYFFQKGYTIEDYVKSAKSITKKIRNYDPDIKIGIVAAPLGKSGNHRHNRWNSVLSELDFYDAIIVHSYAKVIKGKDQYGQMITEEKESDNQKELFNIYKTRTLDFLLYDLHDEINVYYDLFNRPIWITEWNLQMSKTTANTMLQSLFVASYLLEIASSSDYVSLTTYHNLAGRDYSGSIFNNHNQELSIHSTYYPLRMIGEIFNINGDIKINRNNIAEEVFQYDISINNELRYSYIINWANDRINLDEMLSAKRYNSYYFTNLYDKSNDLGCFLTEEHTDLEFEKVYLREYSISLIEFK